MKVRSLDVSCDVCGDGIVWRRAQRAGPPDADPPPLTLEERDYIKAAGTVAERFAAIEDIIRLRDRRRRRAAERETPAATAEGGVPWRGAAGWYLSADRDLCPDHAPANP